MKDKIALFSMVLVSLVSFSAEAEIKTLNKQVTAKVNSTCLVSATNIDFVGNYSPGRNRTHTGGGRISLYCSKNMPLVFSIDGGNSGNIYQRFMIGSTGNNDTLNYNIYYGNDKIFDSYEDYGIGVNVGYQIDAKIPEGQYVKSDIYKDVLTVNVDY